jgi:putative transposase
MLAKILTSLGSVGDAYDNALAESTIGLFKTEEIQRVKHLHAGLFENIYDIEFVTMGLVGWFNNRHLHSSIDYAPSSEFEATYYGANVASQPEMSHA